MKRHPGLALLAVLLVITVLAGCGAGSNANNAGKQDDGSTRTDLKVAMGALPKTGDPNFDSSLFAYPVYRAIFDTLVETDSGKPAPALAESWKLINDTTWEFKLRKDVKFHNGEEFNAETVKWNLERMIDPAVKSVNAGRVAKLQQVDIVDSQTVRIVTKGPWATLLQSLPYAFMLPKKYLSEKGQAGFNQAPVGTGPFKMVQWKQDELLTTEANAEYWRGAPTLKKISFQLMPEGSARVAALEAGEADLVYALPPEHIQRMKDRGLSVITNAIGHSFIIVLRNNQGGPLADVRVRQAINYAVDKDAIIKTLLGGVAKKLEGQLVGSDANGFNPDIKAYPYDPEKAKTLLAEAGYPTGFTVKFEGSAGRYIKDKEVEEAVVQQLARVGIKAELQILESGVWLDRWQSGQYAPMFDVAILFAPPMDLETASIAFVTGASKIEAATDPELTALYQKQASILDAAERTKVLHEMSRRYHDQAFALYLFQVPGIFGLNAKVQNIDFKADYSIKDILKVSVGK